MSINWGGDLIFRDTRLPSKRLVLGSPRTPVSTDIREYLRFSQDRVLRDVLAAIPEIPDDAAWGAFDRRAWLIWDFVARQIEYRFDIERERHSDFWLFPDETLSLAWGDCEDCAILLAAMLLAARISSYCVRVVLGKLYDANGVLLGQHAWPVYQDERGVWRLLEPTLDVVPSALPAADALATPGGPHVYWPEFCFNDSHLWWIRPPNQPLAVPPSGLGDYLVRDAMAGVTGVEMRPERRQAIRERMEQLGRMGR